MSLLEYYKKIEENDSEDSTNLSNIADILTKLGRREEAAEYYKKSKKKTVK